MIFEDKPITLKDGRTAILKSPCVEDAEKLLNYIKTSCGETEYLARYPEEWNTTVEQEEAWVIVCAPLPIPWESPAMLTVRLQATVRSALEVA